jgi:hypothetical protein
MPTVPKTGSLPHLSSLPLAVPSHLACPRNPHRPIPEVTLFVTQVTPRLRWQLQILCWLRRLRSSSPTTEDEQDENEDDDTGGHKDKKRASQNLYYSRFIRFVLLEPPPPREHLFCEELEAVQDGVEGVQIVFYKPPHDRAAAVKELFPTELVPASAASDEHEEGGEADSSILASVSEESPARRGAADGRKSVFWGRRTHPDLVRGLERIEKGSFEAHVHEAVLATTFDVVSIEADEAEEPEDAQQQRRQLTRSQAWWDFASSIVLCLTSLVGAARFESEFLRCCSYLVSGAADDSSKTDAQTHVTWLAMEYLRYHGSPIDPEAWEE